MSQDYRVIEKDGPYEAERQAEAANGKTTAVGVYEDRRHAHIAVDELCRSGFSLDQIGFVMPEERPLVDPPHLDHPSRTGEGAAAGAAAGGTLGSLVGAALATVVLPGIGPIVAGGLMAGGIAGAALGMAGGGVLGALLGMSVPEEEAHVYEQAFHSGRTIVTVQAGPRYDEAVAILRRAAEAPDEEISTHPHRLHVPSDTDGSSGTGRVFVD
jgi:hypothetical protein